MQPRRCDKDASDEREGEGESAAAACEDMEGGGRGVDVQGLGAELYTVGAAYDCYVPVSGTA